MDVSELLPPQLLKDNTIKALKVLHYSKSKACLNIVQSNFIPFISNTNSVYIETCLRKIWITRSDVLCTDTNSELGIEVYYGIKAYEFLLNVTTGLKSEVIGETDIFGQFKESWIESKNTLDSDYLNYFEMIIRKCCEDTKEIRTHYIQNIGGSSYGSILRKIIAEESGKKIIKNILVIGAGKLSKSILPWLIDIDQNRKIKLWNRTVQKSIELVESLKQGKNQIEVLRHSSELELIKDVDLIIFCVPEDKEKDLKRILEIVKYPKIKTIHLGVLKPNAEWNQLSDLICLEDIFKMQDNFNEKRDLWISRAQNACIERARLRALGGALSLAHGWEDLASFA